MQINTTNDILFIYLVLFPFLAEIVILQLKRFFIFIDGCAKGIRQTRKEGSDRELQMRQGVCIYN